MRQALTGAMLAAFLLAGMAACQSSEPQPPRTPTPVEESERVTKYVDRADNVVCYFVGSGTSDGGVSIDCIELTQP